MRSLALTAATLLLAAPSFAQLTAKDARKRAETQISAVGLRSYLTFIAADALRGRDTPSQGLDVAAEFLAFHLRRLGLKPAGDDGTYFQRIALSRVALDPRQSNLTLGDKALRYNLDYAFDRGSAPGSASGPVSYFAEPLPETTELTGRIVVLGPKAAVSEGVAKLNGAVAVLKLSEGSQSDWLQPRMGPERKFYRPGNQSLPTNGVPVVTLSPEASQRLLASGLQGLSAKVTAKYQLDSVWTQNVVATIEGSDPQLKSEYVALGAHYDHVGASESGTGDTIFNGADDDGSGTVSILAIAQAAAAGPRPKRSLIFVWHCGEEKGLWGSDYFVNHPTVPLQQVVAQLNIDMIGRSKPASDTNPANRNLTGPNAIYVVGTTMMSTTLGNIIHGTNNGYLKLTYDPKYDSPNDPESIFTRSDHYNYARKGIPICFWFDGVHEDYHRPGDEVSKIDFTKMEKIVRTIFLTAVEVANLPKRPAVDKPLGR